ncbi:16S rRNA (cytosine(1402)-N(4))-methyltransferase RsmH [Chloroflexota bacterium]
MSPNRATPCHVPVLLQEVVKALEVQPGGRYIDCTLGGGGHASAILEHSSPGGQLLGIDADPEAIKIAGARLDAYRDSILLVNENFANLQAICLKHDFFPVHGIIFDLGLSSLQLNGNGRGFSFQHDAPLDMRFSPSQEVTAADIVNTLSETELANLIRKYGEENYSYRIARYIMRERPIYSTLHLAQTIERAIGRKRGKIHPATKTFQALRIVVNRELENLEAALKQAINLLGFEGRLVVISYHSLEDRIVKKLLQREARDCICPPGVPVCICGHKARLRLVNKRVIVPSPLEIELNPRSRSAKLRAAERLITQDDCCGDVEVERFFAEAEVGAWRRPALLKKLEMIFAAA